MYEETNQTLRPASLLQPKVAAHCGQCSASSFTCIDCSRHFDRRSVQSHVKCVTEHEKYAQGATKPGGYAAQGFFDDTNQAAAPVAAQAEPEGLEFLSSRPPWTCSICNVTCTSQDTLLGHAQGAKHKRRAKAAIAARNPKPAEPAAAQQDEQQKQEGNGHANHEAGEGPGAANGKENNEEEPNAKGSDKKVKWKKLAAAELKKSSGGMKTKKLLAALAAAAQGATLDGEAVLKKLQKSKKFEFEGKMVRLRG